MFPLIYDQIVIDILENNIKFQIFSTTPFQKMYQHSL